MYSCLIVDDEELARNLIKNHLGQIADFELVGSCGSAIEASQVLQQRKVDLLFLDIEMPVLRGTDFFKNLVDKPQVIFTTAYRDYALDGFELNAVDYLLKPISFARFFKAIEKFRTLHSINDQMPQVLLEVPARSESIFIRKDRKQVKVMLDDILYVESVKDYIKIIEKEETHMIKHSMTSFMALLDRRFLRVHRSFIVNMDKITAFTKQDVEINQFEIPIGESYKDLVLKSIK